MTTSDPYSPLTGLFLGAGASYELGMPLVWGLTKEIKDWLTPDQLRKLNRGWRTQGEGGNSDSVIDDLIRALTQPEMHYESIIGYLESRFRQVQGKAPRTPQILKEIQDYSGLAQWLLEMVYWILYFRHLLNEQLIEEGLRYFEGIAGLAANHRPLWVFSLNHDLMVECIATKYGIPINSGLTGEITFPLRDPQGTRVGELQAEIIRGDEIKQSGMPFWQPGTNGINLVKIHGALDVFYWNDSNDLVKLRPTAPDIHGVINSLRVANEQMIYIKPGMLRPVKATNYITYQDDDGELQILGRSLLSGAHKFGEAGRGLFPGYFLDCFRSNLNYLASLTCVGYGFGDDHINKVILSWLEFSDQRRLVIVGPDAKAIPPFLLHLARQVEMIPSTATDYFARFASTALSEEERKQKQLRANIISHGKEKIIEELQESLLRTIQQQFQKLPLAITVDRATGQTMVDLATVATATGVDLAQFTPREQLISDIRRWLLSPEVRPDGEPPFGNPRRQMLDDSKNRTEAVYRHMIVLAQQAIVAQQLDGYNSGSILPADALANLIFDRLEVEKPNPEAPTVEIDTLYLTLVTEDNVKTEFTVEFGFPA